MPFFLFAIGMAVALTAGVYLSMRMGFEPVLGIVPTFLIAGLGHWAHSAWKRSKDT